MDVDLIWSWYSLITATTILVCFYIKWQLNYFNRKNIKHHSYLPFIGNLLKMMMQKEHFKDLIHRLYNAFPEEKYVGYMEMDTPVIVIKDLQLIKKIGIKDFDQFVNHAPLITDDIDQLFGNVLFVMQGQKWRDMRATLSPAFTSSKMRQMFELITETGEEMADYCWKRLQEPESKERGLLEIEMRDAFTRYTNDVIATTAFGLKINSMSDQHNDFFKIAKKSTDLSGYKSLKFFLFAAFPRLMKALRIKFFEKDESDFFYNLVTSTMKTREDKGIVRNDMIQILIEAKNGSLKADMSKDENDKSFAIVEESDVGKQQVKRKWSENELVAQAVLFFIAGFDTSATLLCFTCHMLTINPEIQKKLFQEIDEVLTKNDNRLNYSALTNMKYLDMVVSESLRMWPPSVAADRQCNSTYKLPPSNANHQGYTIEKGGVIAIPIYSIHRDPQYYPNPEKFDPERFSDENKSNIEPRSYLPFGIGPRNCIGSRFALLETKAVLFHLLSKFEFVETAKTSNPIEIAVDTVTLNAKNGFWIGMKPRA